MRYWGKILTFAAIAGMGACAPVTERARSDVPARSGTQLVVQNRNGQDVAIYLVREGARMRLGTVSGLSKAKFAIPDKYVLGVSGIDVQADAVGGTNRFQSGPVQVFPGARLELTVENAVQLSNFAVHNVTETL